MPTPLIALLLQAAPEVAQIDWQPLILALAGFLGALTVILTIFGGIFRSAARRQEDTFDKTTALNVTLAAENLTQKSDIIDLRKEDGRLRDQIKDLQAARDAEKLLDAASAVEQKTQATLANQTIQDLQTRFNGQREEITKLNAMVATLTAEQTKINNDHTTVVTERDALLLRNQTLETKISELETALKDVNLRNDVLEAQLAELRRDVDARWKALEPEDNTAMMSHAKGAMIQTDDDPPKDETP